MENKYAYQILMEQHKLEYKDLPKDAKIGITAILNIEKAIKMAEKAGKKVTPETLDKIKANDKWVVNEILDFVENTDENTDEIPFSSEEVIEDLSGKDDDADDDDADDDDADSDSDDDANDDADDDAEDKQATGLLVEKELSEMFATGVVKFNADLIKKKYPNVYRVLLQNYDENEENGVVTSNFKLLETDVKETFEISKN